MKPRHIQPLPAQARLSPDDAAALTDLYRRGTPPNTLRAWERDLAYVAAWKTSAFGQPLGWPGPAQDTALELIALGLRKTLACPAPATLDRRIASWQAFHRMRNLAGPFATPLVQQARQRARRANARLRTPKSPKPVTRDVLEALLDTCDDSFRGLRDRAMLMLAFASGGRRRSEVVALNADDIGREDFAARAGGGIQRHPRPGSGELPIAFPADGRCDPAGRSALPGRRTGESGQGETGGCPGMISRRADLQRTVPFPLA
jgi:hypothetical protein